MKTKKNLLLLLLLLVLPFTLQAETFNVKKYGARGNGKKMDSPAIQKAIDACHKAGGGTVLVPAGTYLSATIVLKDNVTLHLEKDALILGTTDYKAYDNLDPFTEGLGIDVGWALLVAVDAKNVALEGGGGIAPQARIPGGLGPPGRRGAPTAAVAESLEQFADALEGSKDFEADLQALIRSVLIKHKRILFNGNGYDDAWLAEAERRGLLNLRTTPEALPYYLADKNVALFTKHRVYTRTEMEARYEIHLENYSKVLNIEALTMLEMARRDIMPAVSSYLRELSETAAAIHAVSVTADCSYEESIIPEMSALLGDAYRKVRRLDEALMGAKTVEGSQALANYYRDKVFSAMAELRITIDQLETMTPSDKWPVPSYGDLLFSVR